VALEDEVVYPAEHLPAPAPARTRKPLLQRHRMQRSGQNGLCLVRHQPRRPPLVN
jgi:hypothetical protein